jgi:hypothetical protein
MFVNFIIIGFSVFIVHANINIINSTITNIDIAVLGSQFMFIVRASKVFAFTTLTADEVAVKVGSSQVEK